MPLGELGTRKMAKIIMNGLIAIFFMLLSLYSKAGSKVELNLWIVPKLSTHVFDGQKIGSGEISTQDVHSGYNVWIDAPLSGSVPNRYLITGRYSTQHELHVILEQNNWSPNEKTCKGIVKQTGEAQAYFDVIADGEQNIPVDEYRITVLGDYFTP